MIDHRRRTLLAGALALVVVRPALATPELLAAAITAFTGGAQPTPGRVTLDVAQLVDNGNTVPVTVAVEGLLATVHVTAIALFNEKNPESHVAQFALGPRIGKPVVATRIRLATSQKLVAVARLSDGSYWSRSADVIVTLAACIEGDQ